MRYVCGNCGHMLELCDAYEPVESPKELYLSVRLCANCVEAIHQEAFDEGLRSAERLVQDLQLSKEERVLHIHLHIGGE